MTQGEVAGACASGARNGSIPTSSTGRRSKPPSTRCPTHGNRGDAPREQNRRQAPFNQKGRRATLTLDVAAADLFSMMLVQASDRRGCCGRPRRATERISSSPSRVLAATPGRLALKAARQVLHQLLSPRRIVDLPGLTRRLADHRMQMARQALNDVAGLVDLKRWIGVMSRINRRSMRLRSRAEVL